MKQPNNRDRILKASVELFNQSGVVAVTTNHIAEHLKISPGNLYFHFRNKEEIIRELYTQMSRQVFEAWEQREESLSSPLKLLERSYEAFFNFRFFHREMYHLRRRDPELAKLWKKHLQKTMRLLVATYKLWVKNGIMKPILDPKEMQMISDLVLITSSAFLQFYESPEKPATRREVKHGVQHIARLLLPYHTEAHQGEILKYLNS